MSLKEIALDFLHLASAGSADVAFARYASDNFRHHNVFFKGDAQTLMHAMNESARELPDRIFEVKRAIEENDFVAVHSHFRANKADRGHAVMHIFRFEKSKIAELWDFGQAVPADSPNQNGMF